MREQVEQTGATLRGEIAEEGHLLPLLGCLLSLWAALVLFLMVFRHIRPFQGHSLAFLGQPVLQPIT